MRAVAGSLGSLDKGKACGVSVEAPAQARDNRSCIARLQSVQGVIVGSKRLTEWGRADICSITFLPAAFAEQVGSRGTITRVIY